MTEKERRTDILLEAIRSDVKLVLEGHSALDKKIDNMEANLNSKIDGLNKKLIMFTPA